MHGRARILTRLNGPAGADIMLIGEAPGRLGAQRTRIPFAGDGSGRRLDDLLRRAGWTRDALFITNAVLCNPQNAAGNNRPPSASERTNCLPLLRSQIEVIDPILVIALGAVALASLEHVAPHGLTVRDAGSEPIVWNRRWLAAAYHPGARAAIHRSTELQRSDFMRLGSWFRELSAGSCACQSTS